MAAVGAVVVLCGVGAAPASANPPVIVVNCPPSPADGLTPVCQGRAAALECTYAHEVKCYGSGVARITMPGWVDRTIEWVLSGHEAPTGDVPGAPGGDVRLNFRLTRAAAGVTTTIGTTVAGQLRARGEAVIDGDFAPRASMTIDIADGFVTDDLGVERRIVVTVGPRGVSSSIDDEKKPPKPRPR